MKIANPCKQQGKGSIILPVLASDTVQYHHIEIFTTSGLTAGKA